MPQLVAPRVRGALPSSVKTARLRLFLAAALALGGNACPAAEATGDYATDLATVYGGYQRMRAIREACETALPDARQANAKAFAEWEARHRDLIEDLRRRVDRMIRGASRDTKDYARKLGHYEGAILQERREHRQRLLEQDREALREHCRKLPEFLNGPDADLREVYAGELKTIVGQK